MPQTTTATAAASTWSAPYMGIQHRGIGKCRVSVTEREGFAELARWTPNCGFAPECTKHETAADARAAGDAWMAMVGAA